MPLNRLDLKWYGEVFCLALLSYYIECFIWIIIHLKMICFLRRMDLLLNLLLKEVFVY